LTQRAGTNGLAFVAQIAALANDCGSCFIGDWIAWSCIHPEQAVRDQSWSRTTCATPSDAAAAKPARFYAPEEERLSMHGHPPANGEEKAEVEAPAKTETQLRRLLRRAARQRHSKGPTTPFGRETDPNREFARLESDRPALWFFGTLPIFMIIYVICVRIKAM
jgi:hypothetical protein